MTAEQHLELSCWAAACQALASVAPRYGLDAGDVKRICETAAAPRAGDPREAEGEQILAVRRIAVGLIEGLHDEGADRQDMVLVAQDAFEARRRLTTMDLPSEILGWDE